MPRPILPIQSVDNMNPWCVTLLNRHTAPWRESVQRHFDRHLTLQWPSTQHITEQELEDGARTYTRTSSAAATDLLWLGLSYDSTSWGGIDERPRTFNDFQAIIADQHDIDRVSLGFLTSSATEYELYKQETEKLPYGKVLLIHHPGFGEQVARDHRHDSEVQTARRAQLAQLRNYLMLRAVNNEPHILWLDADVFHLDSGIVARMMRHADEQIDFGILTARCSAGEQEDYDLNAWQGTREGPRGWDLDQSEIDAGELAKQGQKWVDDLLPGTGDDDLIPLDTVGATILYLRASLVWQGLSFPHQYVVGTRWRKAGWDGIESEGLCYRSTGLEGGRCAALGGSWHVEHTDS
jgi:hypothetical protein